MLTNPHIVVLIMSHYEKQLKNLGCIQTPDGSMRIMARSKALKTKQGKDSLRLSPTFDLALELQYYRQITTRLSIKANGKAIKTDILNGL